jgi:hypothetical protein
MMKRVRVGASERREEKRGSQLVDTENLETLSPRGREE